MAEFKLADVPINMLTKYIIDVFISYANKPFNLNKVLLLLPDVYNKIFVNEFKMDIKFVNRQFNQIAFCCRSLTNCLYIVEHVISHRISIIEIIFICKHLNIIYRKSLVQIGLSSMKSRHACDTYIYDINESDSPAIVETCEETAQYFNNHNIKKYPSELINIY